jgi:hypothetical protein
MVYRVPSSARLADFATLLAAASEAEEPGVRLSSRIADVNALKKSG